MIDKSRPTMASAIVSLEPDARFTLIENDYSSINWINAEVEQPSQELVEQELRLLQYDYESLRYQRLRAAEYPPIEDYVDGVVKGDQEQIQNYIDACLAVKEKYPKPDDLES
jgi:hypothetical protein